MKLAEMEVRANVEKIILQLREVSNWKASK